MKEGSDSREVITNGGNHLPEEEFTEKENGNGDSASRSSSGNEETQGEDGNKGKANSKDKLFVCRVCNRCFGYKHVLQNHERTHTGEKPFECRECHKRFKRDHHLKTHMRLHTGEKPYQCCHCDRQFVQVANLRRHVRVHTGERPYSCEMCTSRFSDSNQLKAHVLIHRGEKPFECKACRGRYRRRHHLLHHKCPNGINKPRKLLLRHDNDNLDNSVCRKSRRKPKHTFRILTPQQRELFLKDKRGMQTKALDMSFSIHHRVTRSRLPSPDVAIDLSGPKRNSEQQTGAKEDVLKVNGGSEQSYSNGCHDSSEEEEICVEDKNVDFVK